MISVDMIMDLVSFFFKPLCLLFCQTFNEVEPMNRFCLTNLLSSFVGLIKCMYCGWEIGRTFKHASCFSVPNHVYK